MEKNTSRWWDTFSAVLLLAAMGTVAMRLRVTEWTANLSVIELLTFWAGLLGLALGFSKFATGWARLFGAVYMLFFIPFQIGVVFEKGQMEWWTRLNNLYARLYYSIADLLQNKAVQDPLLFVSVMAIFFWLIAFLAAYKLTRHGKPWAPVVVSGIGMLIIDFYTPYTEFRDRFSAVFVFLLLLLLARLNYLHRRAKRDWLSKGTTIDPEVGFDMTRSVAVSGLLLVIVAWNIPSMVDALTPGTQLQRQLAQDWETIRDRFQNAVAGLQSQAVATNDFFGSSLSLGVGGNRDEEKVFSVDMLGGKPPPGVRFYWRARGYDFYDGSQWSSTQEKTTSIGANEWPFRYPDWKDRKILNITFNSFQNSMRNFYLPAFPLSIGKSADILGKVGSDNTFDFVGALATPSIRSGEVFNARVWVSAPTVADLRSATTDYPAAVKQTYLQLPQSFNRRIRSLAVQITAGDQTQYDKVMAITNWLRKNITYKITIDNPPPGRDPIEWFLFEYKQGFCNYYATAEVLMLRSIGIPSRMAVGYAEGEFDEARNSFTVLRRDSHAWPEVYFEGFGWVEFEPTAAQPATSLLESAPATPDQSQNPSNIIPTPRENTTGEQRALNELDKEAQAGQSTTGQIVVIILPIATGGLLLGLFFWLQRSGRLVRFALPVPVLIERNLEKRGRSTPGWLTQWAHLSQLSPIERQYIQLGWTLPLLGHKSAINQTPAERLSELGKALPEASASIGQFLKEYEHAEYSPYPYDLAKATSASQRVWRLTFRALWRRLTNS